jgi:hypothetical protein
MFDLDAFVIRGHEKIIDHYRRLRDTAKSGIEYQSLQGRINEESEALTRYLRQRPSVTASIEKPKAALTISSHPLQWGSSDLLTRIGLQQPTLGLKNFGAPLETKNDFANFFLATERWRPGAPWARAIETGTGRVRCRSYPSCS